MRCFNCPTWGRGLLTKMRKTRPPIFDSAFEREEMYSKYTARESRFMKKIISQNIPKKHHKVVNGTTSLFPGRDDKVVCTKRIAILNNVFMKYITDILSTGSIDPSIMEKGLEISEVSITSDFQKLNVYWYSQIQGNEEFIDKRLHTAGCKLHHELSQLKLMGFIPKITFIKDKKTYKMAELQQCFEALTITSKRDAYDTEDGDEVPQNINIPRMTSNIYGLDHDMIMKKIVVAKVKRTKTVHKQD